MLLGVLAAAFVAVNVVLLAASLSRGSPVEQMGLVAPRSPGVQQPPLSLSTGRGLDRVDSRTPSPSGQSLITLVGLRRSAKRDPPSSGRAAGSPFLIALTAVWMSG